MDAYTENIIYENDEMTLGQYAVALQTGINSGVVWKLEGSRGREAMIAIEGGMCMLGKEGHKDYWGNYVPSRNEVKAGTKGSPEYCQTGLQTIAEEGDYEFDPDTLYKELLNV